MAPQNVDTNVQAQEKFARDFVQWQKDISKRGVTISDAENKFTGIVKSYLPKNNSVPEIKLEAAGGITNGLYSLPTDELFLNIKGRGADIVAATAIHELEHAIQSRKIANLYAAQLAAKGKPVTVDNIVNLSSASAMVPSIANGKLQKDSRGNQVMRLEKISMSKKVAEVAVNDYKAGVRQTLAQTNEAERLRKDTYTPEAIQKRARLVIDLATQIPNTPAYYAAEERYTNGLYPERQARDKELAFAKILQKVRSERVVSQSSLQYGSQDTSIISIGDPSGAASVTTLNTQSVTTDTVKSSVEEKYSSELSLAEKRAEAIIAKLEKAGVSQDSDEFKSAFVGVVKNLKNLEVDEKKDILNTQGFSSKFLDPQQFVL